MSIDSIVRGLMWSGILMCGSQMFSDTFRGVRFPAVERHTKHGLYKSFKLSWLASKHFMHQSREKLLRPTRPASLHDMAHLIHCNTNNTNNSIAR